MKRRDDRHVEPRKKADDISARLAPKDPVFVLKVDDINARGVQELGGPNIVTALLLADLKADAR